MYDGGLDYCVAPEETTDCLKVFSQEKANDNLQNTSSIAENVDVACILKKTEVRERENKNDHKDHNPV